MGVFDILSFIFIFLCSILGISCGVFFTCIIIIYRQCRTATNLLVLNSAMADFLANIVCACQVIYQLTGDEMDRLCVFRGFLLQSGCGLLYHTFCVQAIYRLFATIPERRQYFQSKRFIMFIIIMQWIISFTSGLPFLLNDRIKYHGNDRICHVSRFEALYSFVYDNKFHLIFDLGIDLRS